MSGANLPRFGHARIEPLPNGTYRPAGEGKWGIVLEIHDRHNELVDLVAWFPNDLSRWWLRYGDETPLLGARVLAFAADCNQPVNLLPTPEVWLFAHRERSERRLVSIMDWGADLGPLFDGVSRVDCDSPDLRKRFQRALRAWEPQITAPRQGARRVA